MTFLNKKKKDRGEKQISLLDMNIYHLSFSTTGLVVAELLSRVQLFGTLWTVVHQAPLSTGFFRQE